MPPRSFAWPLLLTARLPRAPHLLAPFPFPALQQKKKDAAAAGKKPKLTKQQENAGKSAKSKKAEQKAKKAAKREKTRE